MERLRDAASPKYWVGYSFLLVFSVAFLQFLCLLFSLWKLYKKLIQSCRTNQLAQCLLSADLHGAVILGSLLSVTLL